LFPRSVVQNSLFCAIVRDEKTVCSLFVSDYIVHCNGKVAQ
jgi:hypothetical protein